MERFIKPWLPADAPNYTLIHASLINVADGSIHPNTTVRVSNGRIKSVESETYVVAPSDGQIIDLESKYLLPGLMDSHVHLSATTSESEPGKMFKPEETMTAFRIPHTCRAMLSRGFTTVRDCSGAPPVLKTAYFRAAFPGQVESSRRSFALYAQSLSP